MTPILPVLGICFDSFDIAGTAVHANMLKGQIPSSTPTGKFFILLISRRCYWLKGLSTLS